MNTGNTSPLWSNRQTPRRGFTLIELLCAITVLAVIMIMAGQLLTVSSSTWKKGSAQADNFTQTRAVLGSIERDIQSMVLRRDLAAFVDADGQSACAFYTRLPGPPPKNSTAPNRGLSLVWYQFDATPASPQLHRDILSYSFSGSGTPALTLGDTANLVEVENTHLAKQDLTEGIIAFRMQFLDNSGQWQEDFVFDYDNPQAETNTAVILVSIAVLDHDALQLARHLNQLAALVGKLAGNADSQSYAQLWNKADLGADLVPSVRNGLRVFEKRITLPVAMIK